MENLDKALLQVAIGAQQVTSASLQVSTGGQSLSQGASEQASALDDISCNLREISSMTKQNAIYASEAKRVAEAARTSADKGIESMNRMSLAISEIKTSSDSTAKIVKTIARSRSRPIYWRSMPQWKQPVPEMPAKDLL